MIAQRYKGVPLYRNVACSQRMYLGAGTNGCRLHWTAERGQGEGRRLTGKNGGGQKLVVVGGRLRRVGGRESESECKKEDQGYKLIRSGIPATSPGLNT